MVQDGSSYRIPKTGRNFNDAGPAADGPLEDRSIAAACGPWVTAEAGHRQARDRHRVASPGVSALLEKKVAGRATESSCRGPEAHSGDGLRQFDVGCAPNPRRAP